MTRFTDEILEHLGIDLPSEVSRRKFLKIFGGGIVVTVSANDLLALQEAPVRRRFGRTLPDIETVQVIHPLCIKYRP